MSPFLLCHCVAVPWRCRSGCVLVTLRLGYVAWRLRFVVLRAVALRPRRSCSVSDDCSLPRWASPYWFRAPPSTKSGFLCAFWLRDPHFPAFRVQNRGFCVRMGVFSEIFGRFDTKMGFLCSGSITMVVPANHRARSQNANT